MAFVRSPEKPTPELVQQYLDKWYDTPSFVQADTALGRLFREYCPGNDSIENILLKTASLNDFYSTNIYKTYAVAEHILGLDIDERLKGGDLGLVGRIAETELAEGKTRHFYSFATKYCYHHQPELYAIYDSYVDALLRYYRRIYKFAKFKNDDLKQYGRFMEIIAEFQEFFELENFKLRDIDRFLWQHGKECMNPDDAENG